jgi:hypothetical protein
MLKRCLFTATLLAAGRLCAAENSNAAPDSLALRDHAVIRARLERVTGDGAPQAVAGK